ncbi:MAG: (d)CMP kinase [Deltaproteobacteria bacterium]|jgi:cytidylate kinase|nr:(d)CMP kinase [Deltaproteobacteria bacterium]
MDSSFVITIDGPAGSGKSTLARSLSAELGWPFLDTGALYRAVAVAAAELGLGGAGPEALADLARGLEIAVVLARDVSRVSLAGRDVTDLLRTPEISDLASRLSAVAGVRGALRDLQRSLGSRGGIVTEGRDQGTAIFPEARLKFFLTAAPETRAERRARELEARGLEVDRAAVLAAILARDLQDSTRETDPLREPPDSVRVDSTSLSEREVLELMLARAREVFGRISGPEGPAG